jgi:hypothetical protein
MIPEHPEEENIHSTIIYYCYGNPSNPIKDVVEEADVPELPEE